MADNEVIIRQGDATDFADNKSLTINLSNTPDDLAGYRGRFQLGKVIKDYADITSKSIEIILNADETEKVSEGLQYASFKLFDAEGRPCTILEKIPYRVLPKRVENDE